MTPLLELVLIILVVVIIAAIVVLSVYIVKFIKEATLTMANLKDITETTKKELVPALKSLNNVLAAVDNVSVVTNKNFEIVKGILTTLLGASCFAFSKAKSGGFIKGLLSGFNLFSKKRR